MKSRFAKNVCRVLIRRKNHPDPFWCHFKQIVPWADRNTKFFVLPLFLGGPIGSYLPGLGSCAGVISSQAISEETCKKTAYFPCTVLVIVG